MQHVRALLKDNFWALRDLSKASKDKGFCLTLYVKFCYPKIAIIFVKNFMIPYRLGPM